MQEHEISYRTMDESRNFIRCIFPELW